ncbi:phage holin, LLH family [Filifactor alocis]|uniref:phage holin, LLH family n=1 Tax=Filifactor alocis TaxID=143361 RepID=UPI003C7054CB
MKKEYFEIVVMVLKFLLLVMSVVVVPYIQKYLKQNTTKEQRENALFWVKFVTPIAEELIKGKGKGLEKKEFVLNWLQKNNIKLTAEQLNTLIDMVVKEYNEKNWKLTE